MMIEAQSLTRRFAAVTAVNRVSFQIEARGVVGLLGHAGAGKSTLLKMLSGYLEPTAGSLRVAGHDYAQGCRAAQRVLGYLPQQLPLYPALSVADYLDYCAACKGISRAERGRSMREVLLATDLIGQALGPIHRLAPPLRQMLGIAQALLGSPRLLLLDRPDNGLDEALAGQLQALISRLGQRTTVLFSSRHLPLVEAVCDRLLILHEGQLALNASLAELRHSDTLLLRVTTASESLQHALDLLPEVASVEALADDNAYRLILRAGSNDSTAGDAIAQCVQDHGASVCALQPLDRDLETVFRQATGGSSLR